MTQLRFENPETTEEFCGVLEHFNVSLPLEPSREELGVIVDAKGRNVLTIDVNREADDAEVLGIAVHFCMALNTCGGFKVVAAVVGEDDVGGQVE